MNSYPILYSFRRCPYAMRARLALWHSGVTFEVREILLKDKPPSMLEASPKGTVPVLVLNTVSKFGEQFSEVVIDESQDIMLWALTQNDPEGWLPQSNGLDDALSLIDRMDNGFKPWLDKYKYFERHPERSQVDYRQEFEVFISELETRLSQSNYLLGNQFGFLDAAIAPFIRQFAHVDLEWFENAPYPNVIDWLTRFKTSTLFQSVMKKFPVWSASNPNPPIHIKAGEVVTVESLCPSS